ncbi:MAG: FkbM family methyltransferase [Acidobacteriia bacterium]|nr:FkbM family methyltransferase [Terriglobia bacterium]
MLAKRRLAAILTAVFQRRHWRAAINMFRVCGDVPDAFARYLLARGEYPASMRLKTPLGEVRPTLYSHVDMLTVNEIFCRQDYYASVSDRIIVDFGSNIGLSALYFLTRDRASFVYCYEPLPFNCERFRRNLAGFEGRYQLAEYAVALEDGAADFGYEFTGRFGGIGKDTGATMTVECRDAVAVLRGILQEHEGIDVLKMDIETFEEEILLAIPEDVLRRIRRIYVEQRFRNNPLGRTHSFRQYGFVACFARSPRLPSEL